MCTRTSRKSRRACNQRSRYFVNHYNKVESYSTVYNCGSSTKHKVAEQAADDVEQPEVESVEFMETTTHQSTSVERESCTIDSGTGWSFLKFAAILGGIGLCAYLLGSRD